MSNDLSKMLASEWGPAGAASAASTTPGQDFLAPWPSQTLLQLTGPDSRKFLQGQLTCQIDEVTPGQSLLAAACTPKGRAIANLRLALADTETFLLRVSSDLAQKLLGHFQKYLAFFKAEMSLAEDWCLLGASGERAHRALTLTSNGPPGSVTEWHHSRAIRTHDGASGQPRTELWLNRLDLERIQELVQKDECRSLLAGEADWATGEIEAGLTWIDTNLSERYIPQHLNWHAVDGINFRKGCYTGQEIIARMRYLGQLKKTTFRLLLPEGGATLLAALRDDQDRAAGEITRLVDHEDGSQQALAVLNNKASQGPLQLSDAPDRPVVLGRLPYTVPEQQEA